MSDDESFIRLLYAATVQMHMEEEQFWAMRLGLFLDLYACHKQHLGLEKPRVTYSIDDIM
ncbi:hypothetical protein AGMMS49992_12170 [Clostridia bacterium]|nr:hypothetical protein AGMMS49992_12170 [Clostridia bacterium]